LARRTKKHDAVFAHWKAFGELEEKDFAGQAPAALARLAKTDSARPINTLVAKAFASDPPKTMKEVAKRYGDLLNQLDAKWQKKADRLDAAEQELWQVFYAP